MIRILLTLEIIIFIVAALTHFGFIFIGHEHEKVRIAESIIALILLPGLVFNIIYL